MNSLPQEFEQFAEIFGLVQQREPERELQSDGLSGAVNIDFVKSFIPGYYQAMEGVKAVTGYIPDPIEKWEEDKVYLTPHFRGFVWGLTGEEIPKIFRPESFKPNGHGIDTQTLAKGADKAHSYRLGYRLGRCLQRLPLSKVQRETIHDDDIRSKLSSFWLARKVH